VSDVIQVRVGGCTTQYAPQFLFPVSQTLQAAVLTIPHKHAPRARLPPPVDEMVLYRHGAIKWLYRKKKCGGEWFAQRNPATQYLRHCPPLQCPIERSSEIVPSLIEKSRI
jgi:hypothetical protein